MFIMFNRTVQTFGVKAFCKQNYHRRLSTNLPKAHGSHKTGLWRLPLFHTWTPSLSTFAFAGLGAVGIGAYCKISENVQTLKENVVAGKDKVLDKAKEAKEKVGRDVVEAGKEQLSERIDKAKEKLERANEKVDQVLMIEKDDSDEMKALKEKLQKQKAQAIAKLQSNLNKCKETNDGSDKNDPAKEEETSSMTATTTT